MPGWTLTVAPAATSFLQVSGVIATRRSPAAVSRATPIFTAIASSHAPIPASYPMPARRSRRRYHDDMTSASPLTLAALDSRLSVPTRQLAAPGPDHAQLLRMLASAVRVPDHGKDRKSVV